MNSPFRELLRRPVVVAPMAGGPSTADLVIAVGTRRFSPADYRRSEEIIQTGYEAAKAQQAQLARLRGQSQ